MKRVSPTDNVINFITIPILISALPCRQGALAGETSYLMFLLLPRVLRDTIHTHFVTLMGKWTIFGGWVKHRADKRGKAAKLKYKSFFTSLERADNKTGWVGKKLIVHLPINMTKWVWMVS